MHRTFLRIFAFAFFALLMQGLGTTANAQFRAGIQGAVTDPQGAAIIGATVTLTNKETNRAQQTTSGEEGIYRIDRLAPGNYMLTAEHAGFKKQVLENVVVNAEEVQGLNILLETGEVTETVTVTDEVVQGLNTEDANVSGSITEREVQSLPQVGRDPYELIRLTPGVFGLGARSGTGGSVGLPNSVGPGGSNDQIFATENRPAISANGQRVEANNFQIDGVGANSQAWGGAAVVTPNQESVKEIKVLANSYSAEYGRNSGAQVLVVSQSGGNDFHGSLFFKRNTPGMNAVQDFTRAGTAIREDPQRVNQFLSQYGGSIGGPIYLPRFGEGGPAIWSGKNKLFFFFSYETVRRSSTRQDARFVETPQFVTLIANQRAGSIANRVLSFPGMTPPRIASVQSRDCAFLGVNDPTRCQVVSGGLDIGSLGGAIGQTVTSVGGGLDGIPDIQFASLTIPNSSEAEQYNLRIDYQVTQNDLVAFSMYRTPNTANSNNPDGNRGRPGLDFESGRRNSLGTLLWTRTLSPTLINEARFNVTRWYFDEVQTNQEVGYGIPNINICCNPDIPFGQHVGPGVFYQNTYNFRDTVSKVWNAHGLKFGVDVIKEQNNDRAPWAGRPTFEFSNFWSFANDAPSVEAAFYDPATGSFTDLAAYARTSYYALFAQDDWKIRPNLTLNFGLRWEYFAPLRSKRDRISNLILGPSGSLVDASIRSGGDLFNPDKNNFGPQVGFAWSPKSVFGYNVENRAVLRGGFGIAYNRLPGSRLLESRFNIPFFANFRFEGATAANIRYRTASDLNSLQYPPNPAATLTFDPTTGMPTSGPPVGINATLQDVPNNYAYRYSLSAEYDVGRNWIASFTYQGSNGRKLPRFVPYHRLVTPNPRLSNVNMMLNDAYSNYSALLAGATHRFSNGFLVNAEYRFAKSLDTCSNDHDCRQTYPFDQSTEYGPSDFDVRHSFRGYGVWELPFFRNRNDWVKKVAGGWELSSIVTASGGFPWTPVVGGAACNAVVAGGGVCPLRPIAQIRPPATEDTSNDTFLGAGQFPGGGLLYFTPPPTGSFVVPPRPGVGRNIFRGPGYFSVDMTAVKRFGLPTIGPLNENAGIELRFNAYNLFNRLNLEPFRVNDDNTRIEHVDFGRALHALSGRTTEVQIRFNF